MSPFAEAALAHSTAIDEVMGERLRVRPQSDGGDFTLGGDAGAVPDRVGTITRQPVVTTRAGRGAAGADNARLATANWQVGYAATLLPLASGDLVVRLDPPFAGQVFRLAAPERNAGRILHPAEQIE